MADVYSTILSTTKALWALKEAIGDYKTQDKTIEDLFGEVETTLVVLARLNDPSKSGRESLKGLQIPLKQCTRKCEELKRLVEDCTAHSHGNKRSLRDFISLKWNGKDISDFQKQLNSYKLTVVAATLTDIMKKGHVSDQYILENQRMINATIPDLEQRLNEMNSRLEVLPHCGAHASAENVAERSQLLDEKESIMRSMDICNAALQALQESNKCSLDIFASNKGSSSRTYEPASTLLDNAFKESRAPLEKGLGGLGELLERIETRLEVDDLRCQLKVTETFNRFAEERRSSAQGLSAGKDSSQIIVSNSAGISASDVRVDDGGFQMFGQMADITVQHSTTTHAARKRRHTGSVNNETNDAMRNSLEEQRMRSVSKVPVVATMGLNEISYGDEERLLKPKQVGVRWKFVEIVQRFGRKPKSTRQAKSEVK